MLLNTGKTLTNEHKKGLHELGFPVQLKNPDVCLAAPKAKHARKSVQDWAEFYEQNGVPEGDQIPMGRRRRTCIEWCSGPTSRLGREGPHTAGCARVRLTIKDDLTTKGGLDRAMHEIDVAQAISPGRLLLWAAIPCIGGCPWQRLNRRHPRAKTRIEQHRAIWLGVALCEALLEGAYG